MSVVVMTQVWSESPVGGTPLLLMLALADFANEEGVAWPSVKSLAAKTRTDRRTVQRQLRALEEEGLIEVVAEAASDSTSRYQLHPLGRQDDAGRQNDAGRQIVQEGAARVTPNPSKEPSVPSSKEHGGEADEFLQVQEPPEPTPLFEAKTEMDRQIEEVWAYYCERATPVNTELTPARKRMLRSALKEATVEECKLAIDGNRVSSWHKERGKHNLSDIFRPGRDGNLRRQLDRFISDAQAAGAGALPKLSSASMTGLAREMKNAVLTMASYDTEDARKKGQEAVEWLQEHGVTVTFRESDGWPIFSDQEPRDAA